MRYLLFILLLVLVSAGTLRADPSGDGHVHNESTAVSDGASTLPMNGANQMPPQLLQGTSLENQASQPREIEPLQQAGSVAGNGQGALSIEDRIGRPGEDPLPVSGLQQGAASGMPRSQLR